MKELLRTKKGFTLDNNLVSAEYVNTKIIYYSSKNPSAFPFFVERNNTAGADYFYKDIVSEQSSYDQVITTVMIHYYRINHQDKNQK